MNICVKSAVAAISMSSMMVVPFGSAIAQSTFPEKCKSDTSMAEMPMMGGNMPMEGKGAHPTGDLNDHQKASMEGMMSMHQNMMQGMMKQDADTAFACGMIAHHMGAISMAEVELQNGDNDAMKATAQQIIDAQTKEIEELTSWIEKEVK